MPERVLITGGAGFIGRRVTALLLERGVEVSIVDDLSAGVSMPPAHDNLIAYEQDIRDTTVMWQLMAEIVPDAVIHLAALHHIPTCERDPGRAMDININGTQSVLDAMAGHDVRQMVLASTAAVYDWQNNPLSEDETPLRANDVYSTTKLKNEQQVAQWSAIHGGVASIARIFNTIGHDDPNGHLIPDIIAQLADGNNSIQLGNTAPKRDYTHADDIAAGIVALLEHPPTEKKVETYNLSYGVEHSVIDMVRAIGEWLDRPLTVAPDPGRVRNADRLSLLGDPSKTERLTGWRAQLDLSQSLARILPQLLPDSLHRAS